MMNSIVRRFDPFLRRLHGVFEYWDHPDCLFRLQFTRAPHLIRLPDGDVPAGAPVLGLHFFNENMPQIPEEGPYTAFAVRGARMLKASFRQMARAITERSDMADIRAIGGTGVLLYPGAGPGAEKLMERLGFTIFPYRHPLGAFGEFWENLYTWALIRTYNEVTLQRRRLMRLKRRELWMSPETLVRVHGEKGWGAAESSR
jgi:hypothetical protein